MAEPITSPDGNFLWDGDKWVPISNNAQSFQMQDSVMSGDVVTNISHNSADSEVLKVALEGVGKLMQSSSHFQQTPPSHIQQQPTNEHLHTITLDSSEDEYNPKLIYSPLLSEELRNAVDKMNQFAAGNKKFPTALIDLHLFDEKTSNYMVEIWKTLCTARMQAKKEETIHLIIGLAFMGLIGGFFIYGFIAW